MAFHRSCRVACIKINRKKHDFFPVRKLNETSVLVDLADQLCVVLKTKIVINRSDLNILSFERDCHESNFVSADDFVLNSIYVFDSTRVSCNKTNRWIYWVQMSAAIRRIRNATMTLTLTAIICDWISQAKQTLHPIMLYCDKLLFWVRHRTVTKRLRLRLMMMIQTEFLEKSEAFDDNVHIRPKQRDK